MGTNIRIGVAKNLRFLSDTQSCTSGIFFHGGPGSYTSGQFEHETFIWGRHHPDGGFFSCESGVCSGCILSAIRGSTHHKVEPS